MKNNEIRETSNNKKEIKQIKPLYKIGSPNVPDNQPKASGSTDNSNHWNNWAIDNTDKLMQLVQCEAKMKKRDNGQGEGIRNLKNPLPSTGTFDFSDICDSARSGSGQGPIDNSKILYVQKLNAESELGQAIKLNTWTGPNIVEPNTTKVMDLFVKPGDPAKPFEEGHAAYYAMVATPTGNGKWYLAEHHLGMKVSAVELEITSDGKYNTKYHFADKTNNESS